MVGHLVKWEGRCGSYDARRASASGVLERGLERGNACPASPPPHIHIHVHVHTHPLPPTEQTQPGHLVRGISDRL